MSDQQQQKLLGYFAVVLLGLMGADLLSDWMLVLLEPYLPWLGAHHGILTTSVFFAICFANPYLWVIGQARMRQTLVWALGGLGFGVLVHLLIIEPVTGMALARFTMLFVAALGVPCMALRGWMWRRAAARRVETPPEPEDYSDLDDLTALED